MITPSFGLTATERVLPKLALDFTTAILDPRVTFTRALDTATVTDATGAVVLVSANTPRFDYANGVCKGLLIEESRTNLLQNSIWGGAVAGTPGTAPTNWIFGYNLGDIVSVAAGTYASGNAIRMSASANRQALRFDFTTSASVTYTLSVSVYVNSGNSRVDNLVLPAALPTGATASYFVNGVSTAGSASLTLGVWNRVSVVIATSTTTGTLQLRIGIGCSFNQTADATFDMPQLEVGAFSTSYIPTSAGATSTRNADLASMTGTNFSDWFNATEGTFVTRGATGATTSSFPLALYVSDGTTQNRMTIGYFNFNNFQVVDTNVSQCGITTTTPSTNVQTTTTAAYKLNNFAASTNASNTVTDTLGTVPTVNQLRFGATLGGGQAFNGPIQRFFYYPQRLTNAEVQAFSKG
jgi:hypothetical protein